MPSISPNRMEIAAVANGLVEADEQQAQPEREREDYADLSVAIGGAATECGYRQAAEDRAQKKTDDGCNSQQYRPRRSGETDLGEGVGRERGTTEDHEVARDSRR